MMRHLFVAAVVATQAFALPAAAATLDGLRVSGRQVTWEGTESLGSVVVGSGVEFATFGDFMVDFSGNELTLSRTGPDVGGGLNFLYPEGGPYLNGFGFTFMHQNGEIRSITETSREGWIGSRLVFTPGVSSSGTSIFVNLAGVSFHNPYAAIHYQIDSTIEPIPVPGAGLLMATALGLLVVAGRRRGRAVV